MKKVRFLAMDVDGTLTDGKIYMGAHGEVFKAFDIKDGCGIHDLLIPHGILPIVITGRCSTIVKSRCRELGIREVHQGVADKHSRLMAIISKYARESGNSLQSVAYIGDDINDLPIMRTIKAVGGIVGCPFDAADDVKKIADFVSSKNGGAGAVREFIEWILE